MKLMMTPQLLLLKSGIYLLSQTEQLDEEPACHLIKPYQVSPNGTLTPWPLHTVDDDVLIYSDTIATILEPTPELAEKYRKHIE